MEEELEDQAEEVYKEQVVDPVVDKGLDEADDLVIEQSDDPEKKERIELELEGKHNCKICQTYWRPGNRTIISSPLGPVHAVCLKRLFGLIAKADEYKGRDEDGNKQITWY